MTTPEMLKKAADARTAIAAADTEQKNAALLAMADALAGGKDAVLAANRADVEAARGLISPVMIDRLSLNASRIDAMLSSGIS